MREESTENQSALKGTEFLRRTVPYEFTHPPVSYQKVYRDEIAKEMVSFEQEHQEQHGNPPGFKRINLFRQGVEKKYADQHLHNTQRILIWERSERLLDLLRTKGMIPEQDQSLRDENFKRFIRSIDVGLFPEINPESAFYQGNHRTLGIEEPSEASPNHYFAATQPKLFGMYGMPFLTAVCTEAAKCPNHYEPDTRQNERITGINTMFWAAYLGGDSRLHHDVIYYQPDETFYFFDLVVGCYVPTSEAKLTLGLWLSIQQCACAQQMETAKMIMEKCRTKAVFKEVIDHAKTILAADAGFFQGTATRPRWRSKDETEPESTVDPVAVRFVEDDVEPAEGAILPVKAVLERYRQCPGRSVLSDRVLREQIEQAVGSVHGRTPRNDLRQPNGSCVASWKGLSLRVNAVPREDLASDDQVCPSSVPPGQSGTTGAIASVPIPPDDVVLLN